MIRFCLLVLVVFLFHSQSYANTCADLLSSSSFYKEVDGPKTESLDGTQGFIGYMGELLEVQIIGNRELVRLIEGLEADELRNPILREDTEISSKALIHYEGIQEYILKTNLNREKLLGFAKKNLKEKERVRVKREATREETQDLHQKMEFNPVPKGRFQMGRGKDKKTVNLKQPIEVMSTPVTQKQWVEIMEENPSVFTEGEYSIVEDFNGKPIKMQPDNPVDQVTWWSVIVYANKLSEKEGLQPAYDLSGIKWKSGTSAEAGTLDVESGEIKVNAPDGGYYQTEGYRLPTEAEQEYMLRAAGTANGKYHFGENETELADHAWYSANSDSKTHPVGQLKPLIIDGKEFYDLLGNVSEWGWDWYASELWRGDNPIGAASGSRRVLRGSAWFNDAEDLQSAERDCWSPGSCDAAYSGVFGFRLLRTLR